MKLHIGCGSNYFPDWVNLDISSCNEVDVYSSVLSIPYPQETFSVIYSSHVLEHLNRRTIHTALSHWRSLLKPGGVLRLAIPNFAAVCSYYNSTKDLPSLVGLLYGGQDNVFNTHYIIFDLETITNYLTAVGFTEIREYDWRGTEHAEFDDFSQAYLPHMDKENGMLMSLNIEAIK